jgi:uroporphyrinogen III methyltransferase/synthase
VTPDPTEPLVFLVGAGPGDPGLLTLRAVEILAAADLVLYDQLVPRRLLDFAAPHAERVCVRDLPATAQDKYPNIYARMIEGARAGKRVVRLKGGDPLVFGRGGEEAEALRASGIPYEIVPGVTAALATAAFLDIPLTHRSHTSAVAFVTGHELPTKPGSKLDWEALARFPGTLAVYMGIARLPILVSELLRHGKPPDTPAVIAERVSTGEMRSVKTRLADLEAVRRAAGLEAPGLILIGECAAFRPDVSWFEARPLFGRRVLVTRPRHQAEPMVRALEHLGAVPAVLPTMTIRDPADFGPLDDALAKLRSPDGGFDWVVFTSANGVTAFFRRLKHHGRDVRDLGRVKLAAIGPKTADALRHYHLTADVVPDLFIAEGLVAVLRERVKGQRVLLVRANRGRDHLPNELSRVASVSQVTAYEQVDEVDAESPALAALRRGEIEFVTLSSSNVARGLLGTFDEHLKGRVMRGDVKLVCISPETGKAVRELGYPVAAEATVYTADGLIDAVKTLAAGSAARSDHHPHADEDTDS